MAGIATGAAESDHPALAHAIAEARAVAEAEAQQGRPAPDQDRVEDPADGWR
jgi:hypothetical protein